MSLPNEIYVGWRNYVTKKDKVIEEIAKKRMETCNSCEFLRKNKTCSRCNCFMPAKTRNPKSKCPINLWLPLNR